jgi:hypothetical protein
VMTDSSLAAPSVTASEEAERREEEEKAYKAGIALILSRLASPCSELEAL